MSAALWIVVGVLVVGLAALQLLGVRALESWGVESSRAVLGLRIANFALVAGVITYAAIVWLGR